MVWFIKELKILQTYLLNVWSKFLLFLCWYSELSYLSFDESDSSSTILECNYSAGLPSLTVVSTPGLYLLIMSRIYCMSPPCNVSTTEATLRFCCNVGELLSKSAPTFLSVLEPTLLSSATWVWPILIFLGGFFSCLKLLELVLPLFLPITIGSSVA